MRRFIEKSSEYDINGFKEEERRIVLDRKPIAISQHIFSLIAYILKQTKINVEKWTWLDPFFGKDAKNIDIAAKFNLNLIIGTRNLNDIRQLDINGWPIQGIVTKPPFDQTFNMSFYNILSYGIPFFIIVDKSMIYGQWFRDAVSTCNITIIEPFCNESNNPLRFDISNGQYRTYHNQKYDIIFVMKDLDLDEQYLKRDFVKRMDYFGTYIMKDRNDWVYSCDVTKYCSKDFCHKCFPNEDEFKIHQLIEHPDSKHKKKKIIKKNTKTFLRKKKMNMNPKLQTLTQMNIRPFHQKKRIKISEKKKKMLQQKIDVMFK